MSNDQPQDRTDIGFQQEPVCESSVLSLHAVLQPRSARAPQGSGEGSRQVNPSATVHLVDDDCAFLTATSRLLTVKGFSVSAFDSPTALLSRVSAETRGCLVTDLDMPDMTGLQLQALLRLRGVGMPVVFLTGHGDIPSSVQAMRCGAVDCLEKPAPTDQLTAAIIRALEKDPSGNMTVMEAGSPNPVVTYPNEVLYDAAAKMLRANVGRLPVCSWEDPGKPVGYLGRSQVMAARMRRLEEEYVREPGWMRLRRQS